MTLPTSAEADQAFFDALRDDDPELLYDTAPCGYLSTTPDGLITKANQTLLILLGRRRDEVVGRLRFADLLTAGGRIYHETHYAPMLAMQGSAREIALEVVRGDGTRLPVLVNSVLDRNIDGAARSIRTAVFDATQRRAYEQELKLAKERAQAAEARAVDLARTLQQTLIPPLPPHVPSLDCGAVFRAGASGVDVGGDFYDIFQVGADEWVVILGDVCGKGVEAAMLASLTRYTLRAVCMEGPNPADALRRTNDVLQTDAANRFCSAVCVRLRRVDGEWRGVVSSAGHPLPLLRVTVAAGREVRSVGRPGTLLNVLAAPPLYDTDVVLRPGDALLLCTDGVHEARRGSELFGDARIAEVLRTAAGSAQDIADRLLDDTVSFGAGAARDDVAIVVLQVPQTSAR
ncbi:MAG: phosphoserine phosphatase RsbU/P [Pseudonocardiales bacterium]|nr:phosphoserine phosphatase RsbU/P [Pseudonocardiales bacterium]